MKPTMKKILTMSCAALAAALATATTGCRAVTVENYGEEVARDADDRPVTLSDGRIQTVRKGWRVHHNQHWMTTKADAISAAVRPEEISFSVNGLNTQPSDELAKLVDTGVRGMTDLVVAVGEAYVKIAGGGAQADAVLDVAARVANYFRDRGGDPAKAAVSEADGKLVVSDGATTVECDRDGNCSPAR